METASNLPCQVHVTGGPCALYLAVHLDMQTRNKFGITELPDVEVMCLEDTREGFDISRDFVDGHADGDCLKKDSAGSFAEREGAAEDDDGDDKRNAGVKVVPTGEGGEPDDQCRSYYTNVAKCVTHNMKEDASHVQVSMRVTVASMAMTCM